MNSRFREGWKNAYYRGTVIYIAIVVTLIFVAQILQYSVEAKSCPPHESAKQLIPVIGVLLDG